MNFNHVEETFTEEIARQEAARCMQCSTLCDKCIEVCPNRANYTYTISPIRATLSKLACQNGKLIIMGEEIFQVNQKRQIVHLDDFCNECGNCASFCVHNGMPYIDKPRLFLKESDFLQEENNAFYIEDNTIRCKNGGLESKLSVEKDGLVFVSPLVIIHLSPDFVIRNMAVQKLFTGILSLREAAQMAVIYRGITTSLPYLFENSANDSIKESNKIF